MLNIQRFISCFDCIEEANVWLSRNLKIKAEQQIMQDEIFFVYTPGPTADKTNPIVRETHGLILDSDGDILTKLFDYPRIVEKDDNCGHITDNLQMPDGELISVYNYEGQWQVASATNCYSGAFFEFSGNMASMTPFSTSHPDLIFVFSFVSKFNTNIMPYNRQKAFFITAIDRTSGKEVSIDVVKSIASNKGFERPMTTNYSRTLEPGILMLNNRHERLYLPNPIYDALCNATLAGERVTPTHIAKIYKALRDERDLDIVSMSFPRYERMLELMHETINSNKSELYSLWNEARLFRDNQAQFAGYVKHHPLNAILFQYKDGHISSLTEAIHNLRPTKIVDLTRLTNKERLDTYIKLARLQEGGV